MKQNLNKMTTKENYSAIREKKEEAEQNEKN